jgi:ATP-dependent Lon protease
VMKESARAAMTYAATHASTLQIPEDRLGSIEVHIHVPQGAIPKDGPSAGVTMATALVSAMSGRPVRKDVSMTGEITLRGRVLPIGGLKEKLLAAARGGMKTVLIPEENAKDLAEISDAMLGAHRAGITTILLPKENEADIEDIPEDVRSQLKFHCLGTLDEVFEIALVPTNTSGTTQPTLMEEVEGAATKVA